MQEIIGVIRFSLGKALLSGIQETVGVIRFSLGKALLSGVQETVGVIRFSLGKALLSGVQETGLGGVRQLHKGKSGLNLRGLSGRIGFAG
ncbi:hypothetical protein AGMMS49546_19690 [Spirochaetia bacterium]|nr:hypothetical protein AGMMS49546_19690 [Spirochaetia bacterium]